MDKILIDDLSFDCIVGILPEERVKEQELRISAALEVDLGPAGRSGSIADTVDYHALSRMIVDCAQKMRAGLLEELGEAICAMIFRDFARVSAVTLRIQKPEAVSGCAGCGIEITRTAAAFKA